MHACAEGKGCSRFQDRLREHGGACPSPQRPRRAPAEPCKPGSGWGCGWLCQQLLQAEGQQCPHRALLLLGHFLRRPAVSCLVTAGKGEALPGLPLLCPSAQLQESLLLLSLSHFKCLGFFFPAVCVQIFTIFMTEES